MFIFMKCAVASTEIFLLFDYMSYTYFYAAYSADFHKMTFRRSLSICIFLCSDVTFKTRQGIAFPALSCN